MGCLALQNGGFESGQPPWQGVGDGIVSIVPSPIHSGSKACKIQQSGFGGTTNGIVSIQQTFTAATLPLHFDCYVYHQQFPLASCQHPIAGIDLWDSQYRGPEFGLVNVPDGSGRAAAFVAWSNDIKFIKAGLIPLNSWVHIKADVYADHCDVYVNEQLIGTLNATHGYSMASVSAVSLATSCGGIMLADDVSLGGDVSGMTWDIRATDIIVYKLDSQYGSPTASWHVLSGEVPQLASGDFFRIDVRAHNYTVSSGGQGAPESIRLVAQVVGRNSGNLGGVIYTPFSGYFTTGQEVVLPHWIQMWGEPIYVRLWFNNKDLPGVNCPAGSPPPWPDTCGQGEVFDFALSSRHLIAVNLSGGGGGGGGGGSFDVSIQVIDHTTGQSGSVDVTVNPGDTMEVKGTVSQNGVPISGSCSDCVTLLDPNTNTVFGKVGIGSIGPGNYSISTTIPRSAAGTVFIVQAMYESSLSDPVRVTISGGGGGAGRYSCISGQCVSDANGAYSSLQDCVNACGGGGGGGCASDADCPIGQQCVGGQCVPIPGCGSDADCPAGYHCQGGVCVPTPPSGCTDNSQCPSGYICQNGQCVKQSGGGGAGFDTKLAAEIGVVGVIATGLMYYAVKRRRKGKRK